MRTRILYVFRLAWLLIEFFWLHLFVVEEQTEEDTRKSYSIEWSELLHLNETPLASIDESDWHGIASSVLWCWWHALPQPLMLADYLQMHVRWSKSNLNKQCCSMLSSVFIYIFRMHTVLVCLYTNSDRSSQLIGTQASAYKRLGSLSR